VSLVPKWQAGRPAPSASEHAAGATWSSIRVHKILAPVAQLSYEQNVNKESTPSCANQSAPPPPAEALAALVQNLADIVAGLLATLSPRIRIFGLSIPIPAFLLRLHRDLRRAMQGLKALAVALRAGPLPQSPARPLGIPAGPPSPNASNAPSAPAATPAAAASRAPRARLATEPGVIDPRKAAAPSVARPGACPRERPESIRTPRHARPRARACPRPSTRVPSFHDFSNGSLAEVRNRVYIVP
jgi:hypothetical protein